MQDIVAPRFDVRRVGEFQNILRLELQKLAKRLANLTGVIPAKTKRIDIIILIDPD
jgi:hypothetical protein